MCIGHWPVNCATCLACAQCKLKQVVCLAGCIIRMTYKLSDSLPAGLQQSKGHRKLQIHDLSMFYFMCMFVCSFLSESSFSEA
jgi:hypothetical protein